MTYAEHQEAAAKALAGLVVGRPVAAPPTETWREVLLCRRQAVLTLTERMEHLGCLPGRGEPPRHVTVAQVVDQPLWHLAGVVDAMARPELPDIAPSDILRSPLSGDHAVVAVWRSVARELFLATAELQRADLQPWLSQGPPGWYVLGDIADTVCALLALDAKAERAGVLRTGGGDKQPTVRLLIASGVARLARMWATTRPRTGQRRGRGAVCRAGWHRSAW